MYHRQDAVIARFLQGAEQARIVDLQAAFVGHQRLDAAYAFVEQRRNLVDNGVVPFHQIGVVGVIDHGLVGSLTVPRLNALAQRLALVGDRKIDVSGRAAEGRGLMAGVEIVGRFRHADRQLQMRVHVNATGQHIAIGRIDHLRAFGFQTFANHGDLLAVDQ